MKLLVLSDSHGNLDYARRAVLTEAPDMIAHLGDCSRDADTLHEEFPDIPLYAVCGNCDIVRTREERLVFRAGEVTVFATHGHLYSDVDALAYAAQLSGASLCLYGHTHMAKIDYFPDLTVMNPGTVGKGFTPSYGVVQVSDGGRLACRIVRKKLF